jgi:nucleotide-binding universal stress UspA family protein
MPGEIIVGVGPDGSSHEAADLAVELAKALGCGVVLVFGYEPSSLGPRGGPLEDQVEAIASEVTSAMKARLDTKSPEVVVAVELVRDRAVESLLRAAEAFDARMIVVGHGGRGPLRAMLLGSTAYEIVHRSHVPVLVVPSPKSDD